MIIARIQNPHSRWIDVEWLNLDDQASWAKTNYRMFGDHKLCEAIVFCDVHGYTLVDYVTYEVALAYRYYPPKWKEYVKTKQKDIEKERGRLLWLSQVY